MEKIELDLINPEHTKIVLSLLVRLKAHSHESYIHSLDVAEKSLNLAIAMGVSKQELSTLYTASLLHDIGKLHIKPELLHKTHASAREKEIIQIEHIEGTRQILEMFFDDNIVNLAAHHHERLNCSGYPENLNAKKLGLLDRILQVSDVTSALLMDRSYQAAHEPEQVINILDNLVKKGELDKHCVAEMERLYLADSVCAQKS